MTSRLSTILGSWLSTIRPPCTFTPIIAAAHNRAPSAAATSSRTQRAAPGSVRLSDPSLCTVRAGGPPQNSMRMTSSNSRTEQSTHRPLPLAGRPLSGPARRKPSSFSVSGASFGACAAPGASLTCFSARSTSCAVSAMPSGSGPFAACPFARSSPLGGGWVCAPLRGGPALGCACAPLRQSAAELVQKHAGQLRPARPCP